MPSTEYARVPMTLLRVEGQRLRPAMDVITEIRKDFPTGGGFAGDPTWPSWCFYPKSEAVDAIRTYMDVITPTTEPEWYERDLWEDGELAATLLAWRLTRGVYEFDPDLYHSLITTPLTDNIPSELLYRLPEWCVYIPVPKELRKSRNDPLGFFARLNYGDQSYLHAPDPEGHAITLTFVHGNDEESELFVYIDDISLKYKSLRAGIDHYQPDADAPLTRELDNPEQRRHRVESIARELTPYLNVLLYLCSEKPEITGKGKPGNPKPIKTKKGWREFPASGTRLWNVGVRIGATLRKENTSTRNEEHDPATGRARPRPHIRRAHWNTYWTGPKTAPQTPVLRWIPPSLVAAEPNSDEELPTTIRPVKQ